MTMNRQFRLAARPVGLPKATDWQLTEETSAPLQDGEVRVRVLYLSLDPAMRGWMNEGKSYIRPVAIGDVMRAGGVGIVEASNSPHVAVGDYLAGMFGVQQYWTGSVDAKAAAAIASNQEWRETRPAQFSCAETEMVARVREVLAQHGVNWD